MWCRSPLFLCPNLWNTHSRTNLLVYFRKIPKPHNCNLKVQLIFPNLSDFTTTWHTEWIFTMSLCNSELRCFWSGIRRDVNALNHWLYSLQIQQNPNQHFFHAWSNWPESGWSARSERCAGSGDGYLNHSITSFDSDVCRWWLPCWKGLKIVSSPWLHSTKPFYPVTQKHAQFINPQTFCKAVRMEKVKG